MQVLIGMHRCSSALFRIWQLPWWLALPFDLYLFLYMCLSRWPDGRIMASEVLHSVPEVEIDHDGQFKYILVRLQQSGGGSETRDIVRGTASAEFHNHIFEKLAPQMAKLGLECKCLGGGKIDHRSAEKKIRVFGLSTGYGKADHSVTVEKLKKVYQDYDITWSDDKK